MGEGGRGKDRRGLNLPQVVPLSPAKGESDYELKKELWSRSFLHSKFSWRIMLKPALDSRKCLFTQRPEGFAEGAWQGEQ